MTKSPGKDSQRSKPRIEALQVILNTLNTPQILKTWHPIFSLAFPPA